jgi:hypothetical protein
MKTGDYLMCKQDDYIFKKGKRYKIEAIEQYSYSNSGATYGGVAPPDYICYRFKEYSVGSNMLFNIFYNQQEERCLKLKKLQTV